jgi:hypothetical protein
MAAGAQTPFFLPIAPSVRVPASDIVVLRERRIGGGGYGDVFEGLFRSERVAVKEIRGGGDRAVLRTFMNEIKVWDRVRQRNGKLKE